MAITKQIKKEKEKKNMAKNYSLTEAVEIIVENEDAAQLVELGKRFPLLVSKITRIAVKAGEELNDLMQFMPENLSANKVNQSIKRTLEEGGGDAEDEDFEDDGDAEDEAPVKKSAKGGKPVKKEEADAGDSDYDKWNNAKMYKLLGEMGKRKDCKEKYGDLSHDSMVKYLKKYGPGSATAEEEDFEDEDEAAEEQASYDGMNAIELYKLCKSRKIKAEQKKPAKYYIGLLKKADEEAAQAEDDAEDDDEDWDEEDEVEVTKTKGGDKGSSKGSKPTTKPASKTKTSKPAKKEEDDEDWDI